MGCHIIPQIYHTHATRYSSVTFQLHFSYIEVTYKLQFSYNFSYISVTFQLHFSYISDTCRLHFSYSFMFVTFQLLVSYVSDTIQLHFSYISVTYQLQFSYTSVTHQLHFNYISVAFMLHSRHMRLYQQVCHMCVTIVSHSCYIYRVDGGGGRVDSGGGGPLRSEAGWMRSCCMPALPPVTTPALVARSPGRLGWSVCSSPSRPCPPASRA